MKKEVFIFLGRSGSGKGTQSRLLIEHLAKTDERKVLYTETGAGFREFIKTDSYSSTLAGKIMATGGRQPDFLAVHIWSHSLIRDLGDGINTLIIDGTPRSLDEARILETVFPFYGFSPSVVYLSLSREVAIERLLERAREDDKRQAVIEERMNWFDHDVMPVVGYYSSNQAVRFIEVEAGHDAETLHRKILSLLSL
mgnify:CR=1 FL=1